MEYLKERAKKIPVSITGNFFNDYDFNMAILEELKSRNIEIEIKEADGPNAKRFKTTFEQTCDEFTDEDYKKLVSDIADEIEESPNRIFDTLATSSGVVINPATFNPIVSFMCRLGE